MKTACFHEYTGPGRICIARYAPRNTPAGYRMFKRLAPGGWFNSVSKEEYTRRFFGEILGPLDAAQVWSELHELAGGAEPVLLCWERSRDLAIGKTYCHRRMVAEWLEIQLGARYWVAEMAAAEAAARSPRGRTMALFCDTHNVKLVNLGEGHICPRCPVKGN